MKETSARAIAPQKIALVCFQTLQQKGQKIHASSPTSRLKIHSNGLEQACEEIKTPQFLISQNV